MYWRINYLWYMHFSGCNIYFTGNHRCPLVWFAFLGQMAVPASGNNQISLDIGFTNIRSRKDNNMMHCEPPKSSNTLTSWEGDDIKLLLPKYSTKFDETNSTPRNSFQTFIFQFNPKYCCLFRHLQDIVLGSSRAFPAHLSAWIVLTEFLLGCISWPMVYQVFKVELFQKWVLSKLRQLSILFPQCNRKKNLFSIVLIVFTSFNWFSILEVDSTVERIKTS